MPKKASAKRELIDTGKDKRFVRRSATGQFKESDDQGKSLSADRRQKAKRTVKSGYGDEGDQKKPSGGGTAKKSRSSQKTRSKR